VAHVGAWPQPMCRDEARERSRGEWVCNGHYVKTAAPPLVTANPPPCAGAMKVASNGPHGWDGTDRTPLLSRAGNMLPAA
jgi:hypothetical protein